MAQLSKQETVKPTIYVAGDYANNEQVARSMEHVELALEENPFIEMYYSPRIATLHMPGMDSKGKGLFDLTNLEHADVVIAVCTTSVPVEVGHAVANDIPFMIVDVGTWEPFSDIVTATVHKTFTSATALADYNFIKMEKGV